MNSGRALHASPRLLLALLVVLALAQFVPGAARAASDTQTPTLASLDIAPQTVQLPADGGPAVVTVTVRATDDVSGVQGVFIGAQSPTGAQVTGSGRMVSGTALDGIWETRLVLENYADPGMWELFTVQVKDGASRNAHIDLAAKGFPSTFTVKSSSAADTQPAQLASLSVAPRAVELPADGRDAVVTITVRATDDVSGVRNIFIGAQSPTGAQVAGTGQLISGDTLDGIWEIKLTLGHYADPGNWTLFTVQVPDAVRNNHIDLAANGFPDSFCVSCQAPGAPTGVTAVPRDKAAQVSWTATEPLGGIERFVITANPGGAQVQVPGSSRSATFTGLTNGVSYTFAVRAENVVGQSQETLSAAVLVAAPVTAPARPSRPTVTVKGRTVKVSWTGVDDGGSPLISWTVQGTGLPTRTVGAEVLKTTFRKVPYGQHRLWAYATNAVGDSPVSERVRVRVRRS